MSLEDNSISLIKIYNHFFIFLKNYYNIDGHALLPNLVATEF